MVNIEIYSSFTCPFCHSAKSLLKSKGVEFTEHNVTLGGALKKEMIQRAQGHRTVPQIFIDDRHIGGCDDLYALDEEGKLDSLLSGPLEWQD